MSSPSVPVGVSAPSPPRTASRSLPGLAGLAGTPVLQRVEASDVTWDRWRNVDSSPEFWGVLSAKVGPAWWAAVEQAGPAEWNVLSLKLAWVSRVLSRFTRERANSIVLLLPRRASP